MLTSMVLRLRPKAAVTLPMTLGHAVYATMLQLTEQHDRQVAAALHNNEGAKPFTTSSSKTAEPVLRRPGLPMLTAARHSL